MSHGQPIEKGARGELDAAADTALRLHLRDCEACRAEYDERRALAQLLLGEQGHPLERERLFGALEERPLAVPARSRWRWALVPVLGAAALLAVVAAQPSKAPENDIAWRGGSELPRSDVEVSVYAVSQTPGAPVKLVATFPGSGEGELAVGTWVQAKVRGPASTQLWVENMHGMRSRWRDDGSVDFATEFGVGHFVLEIRVPKAGVTEAQLHAAELSGILDPVLELKAKGLLVVKP